MARTSKAKAVSENTTGDLLPVVNSDNVAVRVIGVRAVWFNCGRCEPGSLVIVSKGEGETAVKRGIAEYENI